MKKVLLFLLMIAFAQDQIEASFNGSQASKFLIGTLATAGAAYGLYSFMSGGVSQGLPAAEESAEKPSKKGPQESVSQKTKKFHFVDRKQWSDACKKARKNRDFKDGDNFVSVLQMHEDIETNIHAWDEFNRALVAFKKQMEYELSKDASWTTGRVPESEFFQNLTMDLYTQKLDVSPGSEIIFRGDLHGDICSLDIQLDDLEKKGYLQKGSFELASKNTFLVFLGDYTDRGNYGVEVIYTLLRLKLANPDNVILVRGNHEDGTVCSREGFGIELRAKFRLQNNPTMLQKNIFDIYNLLPAALYLGCGENYLQCCHGGIEHGYKPQKLLQSDVKYDLIGTLERATAPKSIQDLLPRHIETYHGSIVPAPKDPTVTPWYENLSSNSCNAIECNQLVWCDFTKTGAPRCVFKRGLAINKELAEVMLNYQNDEGRDPENPRVVRGVFRGHQHVCERNQDNHLNLMFELVRDNGVSEVWSGIQKDEQRSLVGGLVWTFNVSPDSQYGLGCDYGFDAYGIVKTQKEYKDWVLSVCNTQVITCQECKQKR